MMNTIVHKKIINDTILILKDSQTKKNENGFDLNVFTLLDVERNELTTHENMLYAILNFKIDKQIAEEFVYHLIEVMGLPQVYLREHWEIEREYFTTEGRIDLFFKSKSKRKKCIIVELKIDAGDQEKQIERYAHYAEKSKYDDYRIIYLTLDGKEPSEQSVGKANRRKLKCISFKKHILKWLGTCIDICGERNIEVSFIQQYRILINKMVGENNMKEKVANIISNRDELKASIEIANELPKIKAEILYNFLYAIGDEFDKKGIARIYSDIEIARDYYNGKSMKPDMAYIIKEYTIGSNRKLKFVIGIQVDYCLFYYFGFYVDNDWENSDQIKNKQKRIYQKIEDAISEMLSIEIREHSYESIFFELIKDKNGHKYDFKHFSGNCTELFDLERMQLESKRIARELMEYIKMLKDKLD